MKHYYLLLNVLIISTAYSQNLVADGGLEDTLKCPQSIGRFYHPTNTNEQYTAQWRATTLASPDYHHTCGYNTFSPYTGKGYAGILYYDPTEYREYISALLTDTLIAGERYAMEYYVALNSGSTLAIDEIQVHFSTDVPLDMTFPIAGALPLTPHWQASFTPTSTNYQKVSTCYVANGDEAVMTFGNFMDNANTTTTQVSGSGAVNSYYFIDDVSIYLFDSTASQNGNTLTANMNNAEYQWIECGVGPVNGETAQSFTPTVAGDYAVIITKGDCVDTSACFNVSFAGIDSKITNGVTVFPNPANESVTIEWNKKIETIELRNIIGERIDVIFPQKEGYIEIDLRNLPKGIYFINILDINGWQQLELIHR